MKIHAALILSVAALTGCQQKPFAEYSSSEGKFKAIFPGEPKVTTLSAHGIDLRMYSVESWTRAYMVGWADMPIPTWEPESRTKSRLFDARDGALAAVKGTSNHTTKTILLAERFPGIEFGGTADGKHLRARVYIVGRRMYQALVVARSEDILKSQEAEDFFAAFQVTDPEGLLPPFAPQPAPAAPSTPFPPSTSASANATVSSIPAVSAPSRPAAVQSEMHPLESVLGRFQASYPTKASKFTRSIGATEFTGYASESANGTCLVGYADLTIPAGETPGKLRLRLVAARNAAVAEVKGTLAENKPIALGKDTSGLAFTAKATGKQLRGRIYMVGSRLYQITVLGSEDFANSAEANEFLESFTLVK